MSNKKDSSNKSDNSSSKNEIRTKFFKRKEKIPEVSTNVDITIETVAELIKSGKAKKIIVMCGAGISTAAGIPDFRSPGTGLYDNLQKYNLPYPEAVFNLGYFKENPKPFFELAKELFPTKYLPTLTHYFITLLHRKNLLLRCFTQNVDSLERRAGLPDEKIVEAHGSFLRSKCLKCDNEADPDWVKETIFKDQIPKCLSCKTGIIKPCITFFGESLPDKFFKHLKDFSKCDLLIVIGTSLTVQPFAGLIDQVPSKTPRLLINRERVAEYAVEYHGFDFDGISSSSAKRDVFYGGNCNDGVKKFAELLDWEDELNQLYKDGNAHLSDVDKVVKEFEKVSISEKTTINVDDSKNLTIEESAVSIIEKESNDEVEKLSKDLQKVDINKDNGKSSATKTTKTETKVDISKDNDDDDDDDKPNTTKSTKSTKSENSSL